MAKKPKKVNNFVLFKPFVARLLTYLVLLYISTNNWALFQDNKEAYIKFVDLLNDPVVVDITWVNNTSTCPDKYIDIATTYFPKTFPGCSCDGNIMKIAQCNIHTIMPNLRKCNATDNGDPDLDAYPTSKNRKLQNNNTTCSVCYTNLTGITTDINMPLFFNTTKPCLLYDEDQTTFTYIDSVNYKTCDPKNVCNDYFCKLNNDATKQCPITTVMSSSLINRSLFLNGQVPPFVFSSDYLKYENYDSNYHGYIYLPINQMAISRSGMCDKGSKYVSSYFLNIINSCQITSRYIDFEYANLLDLLKLNGIYKNITSNLPSFGKYTSTDVWGIATGTAMSRDTIYCIINNKLLFISNYFTIHSNGTIVTANNTQSIAQFIKEMYVFVHIAGNSSFQEGVQLTMLIVSICITTVEVLYVLFKMFNVCGDNLKCCLFLCSYEGYLSFMIDVAMSTLCVITYRILHDFVHQLEHLLATGCLDEYTYGKLALYRVATEVVADKNFEIFLICSTKLTLVVISLIYACITKKGRVRFRECEEIMFEREGEESDEEEDKSLKKKKKPNLEKKGENKTNNHNNQNNNLDEKIKNVTPGDISYFNVDKTDRSVNLIDSNKFPRNTNLELSNIDVTPK